jgi:hypothetical protein
MKEASDAMKVLQPDDSEDPIKEMWKSLLFNDTIKEARKLFQFDEPINKAWELIQFDDPIKEAWKALQLHDPMQEARATMMANLLHDPMKESLAAMAANLLHDPMKESLVAMAANLLHDPMKDSLAAMAANLFYEPMKEAHAAMVERLPLNPTSVRAAVQALGLDSIVDAISVQNWPMAYESLANDIVINDNQTVTVDSTTLTYLEIQDIANQIADRAFSQPGKQLEQAVTKIIAELRALRNPVLEKILTWLIFPIVVGLVLSVLNPIADYYIKKSLPPDTRQIEKKIKRHIVDSVKDLTQLDSYRLVSIKVLNARLKPTIKSPVLGRFYFGQAVVLIEKDRNWSLVAWFDVDNGVTLQGWVFSRYLSKLR